MIPDKCKNWKVANHIFTKWWCNFVCGSLTKGRMCAPWCKVVEKYGMWTLAFTLGLPIILVLIIILR